MFTIEEIKQAHSKVKSGADFPAYIRDLKKLGVVRYTTFVNDGHTDYFGNNAFQQTTPSRYNLLEVSTESDGDSFKRDLKAHQQGKSDYPTFCSQCAQYGIEKWSVDLGLMTCTYFDKKGSEILVEEIPG